MGIWLVSTWRTPRKRWEERPPAHAIVRDASSSVDAILKVKAKSQLPREELDKLNWNAENMDGLLKI